jgi:hypothetical protein
MEIETAGGTGSEDSGGLRGVGDMIWTLQRLDQLDYLSRGRSKHRPSDAAHLYDGPYPRMLYACPPEAELLAVGGRYAIKMVTGTHPRTIER